LPENAKKAAALSSLSKGIKEQAQVIIDKYNLIDKTSYQISATYYADRDPKQKVLDDMARDADLQTKALLESYNHASKLASELGLDLPIVHKSNPRPMLRAIIVGCDTATGFADQTNLLISIEDHDKLNSLKTETEGVCKNLDLNFESNLTIAIQHAERADFLGSALITARIISYVLDQIKKQISEELKTGAKKIEIDDIIAFLIQKNALSTNDITKQAIIKADKKSRDILSHRIDVYAEPSDASSLIGDCLKVLTVYTKLQPNQS
jgi:hypothetical protein